MAGFAPPMRSQGGTPMRNVTLYPRQQTRRHQSTSRDRAENVAILHSETHAKLWKLSGARLARRNPRHCWRKKRHAPGARITAARDLIAASQRVLRDAGSHLRPIERRFRRRAQGRTSRGNPIHPPVWQQIAAYRASLAVPDRFEQALTGNSYGRGAARRCYIGRFRDAGKGE